MMRRFSLLVLFASVVLLLSAQSALAKTYTMSVPACAFRPRANDISFIAQPYLIETTVEHGNPYYSAPLYLPQGAILKNMTVLAYDNDSQASFSVYLMKDVGGGYITLCETTTPLDTPDPNISQTVEISNGTAIVDNTANSYMLYLLLPHSVSKKLNLYRVSITYEASPCTVVVPMF